MEMFDRVEPVLEGMLGKQVIAIVNMSPLKGTFAGYDEMSYILNTDNCGLIVVTRSAVDMIMLAATWDLISKEEEND